MKLFLYSGYSVNNSLDAVLKKTVSALKAKTLAIFLSNSDDFASKYVYPIINYYSSLGFAKISVCLYPKNEAERAIIAASYPDIDFITTEEAFNCDAIFLSGGNNYYFLNSLRKHNMLKSIVDFVSEDKILIGMSAGSMVMQQDITNTSIPSYDIEPNPIGDMDLSSLKLVDFYFFPHFDADQRYLDEVNEFAKKNEKVCYICKDTNGLYVDDGNVSVEGDVITVR